MKKKNLHKERCGCNFRQSYCPIYYQLNLKSKAKSYYRDYHKRNYIPKLICDASKKCVVCNSEIVNDRIGYWLRISCSPTCSKIRQLKKQNEWLKQKRTDNPQWYERRKTQTLQNYYRNKNEVKNIK